MLGEPVGWLLGHLVCWPTGQPGRRIDAVALENHEAKLSWLPWLARQLTNPLAGWQAGRQATQPARLLRIRTTRNETQARWLAIKPAGS